MPQLTLQKLTPQGSPLRWRNPRGEAWPLGLERAPGPATGVLASDFDPAPCAWRSCAHRCLEFKKDAKTSKGAIMMNRWQQWLTQVRDVFKVQVGRLPPLAVVYAARVSSSTWPSWQAS